MRRILFVRIGWMKFYAGKQKGDERPIGGGSFNKDDIGHEFSNFRIHKSVLYGSFARTADSRQLNLKRIDPQVKGNQLKGVLLIFVARDPRPGHKRQVVIGWYQNATLYSDNQLKPWWHGAHCKAKDATLLPTRLRTTLVPHGKGATGQSNTIFVLDRQLKQKKSPWISRVLEFVQEYEGPNLLTRPESEADPDIETALDNALATSMGQGIPLDTGTRKVVENRAMNRAMKYFRKHHYRVFDKSKRKPYDLECWKRKNRLLVEVKGTQARLSKIMLTTNEVKLARSKKPLALFVLHSIRVTRKRKEVKATGGKMLVLNPWRMKKKNLKSVAWEYKLV